MTNGALRAVVGSAALVAGFAVGWFARPLLAPAAGSQVVVVGPRAGDVHPDRVTISKRNKEVLFWVSSDPNKQLTIESEHPLFAQQPGQHGRFAMSCRGRMCFSDEVLETAAIGEHKYYQILSAPGQPDEIADGWIIIDR